MALTHDDIRDLVAAMWSPRAEELGRFQLLADFASGRAGLPSVEVNDDVDLKDIFSICGKNVIAPVVDAFTHNLSVVGYRRGNSDVNQAAWSLWQRQRLDARQEEIHRYVHTYGLGYASVLPGPDGSPQVRYRSPLRVFAVYEDPMLDTWPLYALETWEAREAGKRVVHGALFDDEVVYPLTLGEIPTGASAETGLQFSGARVRIGEPRPHGAPGHVPVRRFTATRDALGRPVGEVEPLKDLQRAINSVNFDRLIVSRFGAFPKSVISGWSGGRDEVLAASARRILTFEDPDVKAQTLMGADGRAYNDLITEMMEHVAMVAKLSPAEITGKMVNLSAEALAAGEKAQQRKLARLKDSLGECHEDVIRLMCHLDGDVEGAQDLESEVVWDDTEARSFAATVDGVAKLAQVGVPLSELLGLVPGLTQAQRESMARKLAVGGDFESIMQQVLAEPDDASPAPLRLPESQAERPEDR